MTYLKEEMFKKPKQLTLWCGQKYIILFYFALNVIYYKLILSLLS